MASGEAYIKMIGYLICFWFAWEQFFVGSWRFKPSESTSITQVKRQPTDEKLLRDDGQMPHEGWLIHSPDDNNTFFEVNQKEARSHGFGS